jgi:hypothetical protein
MTSGDAYRVKAAELHAKARQETNPALSSQLEALAQSYVRLAQQADRNALADVSYETPTVRQPNVQQEQQIQPEPMPGSGIESPEGQPPKSL